MKYKEFLEYMENNLPGYRKFMEKALDYQKKKNADRPAAKRWNDARLQKAAYDMWRQAMEPLYSNLKEEIGSDLLMEWEAYIAGHEVLENVTKEIQEMDFSDNASYLTEMALAQSYRFV